MTQSSCTLIRYKNYCCFYDDKLKRNGLNLLVVTPGFDGTTVTTLVNRAELLVDTRLPGTLL